MFIYFTDGMSCGIREHQIEHEVLIENCFRLVFIIEKKENRIQTTDGAQKMTQSCINIDKSLHSVFHTDNDHSMFLSCASVYCKVSLYGSILILILTKLFIVTMFTK